MRLATVLRKLMNEKRLTSKKLSEEVDIPEGTIKTWLAGSAPRNLSDVRRVSQYLMVSFEYLCFGDESLRVPRGSLAEPSPVEIFLKLSIVETELTEGQVEPELIPGIRIRKLRD
jgi:transcriptional regulator with XRE-family HTH domain